MDVSQSTAVTIERNTQQISHHHDQLKNIWQEIGKIRDRPPVWVSWVLSGAAFVMGIMSTLLVQCIPFK